MDWIVHVSWNKLYETWNKPDSTMPGFINNWFQLSDHRKKSQNRLDPLFVIVKSCFFLKNYHDSDAVSVLYQ